MIEDSFTVWRCLRGFGPLIVCVREPAIYLDPFKFTFINEKQRLF